MRLVLVRRAEIPDAGDGLVPVRDSKAPTGPVLSLPADAFTVFVSGVKGGSFDTV
ncbi:DUF397 domain-containing protein [Streptomyces sp. NPDC091377]|uniref:DUF397 domain-containing protein n=1 Tax=Streptomyces sp. NPDC091377 TaxID=3365995 RepID=UPI00380D74B3